MEKQELLQLLSQRMTELPDIPRKILAMYYFEKMRLAEIAQVFGLTEIPYLSDPLPNHP